MKYVAIGAALTTLVGGTAAYALTQTGEADAVPTPETSVAAPLEQAAPVAKKASGKRAQGKPKPKAVPAQKFGADSQLIKKVTIGMSATDVVATIGTADYCEEESTDFGYDVGCWYGSWLVWHSDSVVQSVTYYESQA